MALLGMSQSETPRTESLRDSDSVWSPRQAQTYDHTRALRMGSQEIRETQETTARPSTDGVIYEMEDVIPKDPIGLKIIQAVAGSIAGLVIGFGSCILTYWMFS